MKAALPPDEATRLEALGRYRISSDERLLDFVEYPFRLDCAWRIFLDDNTLVDEIDQQFLVDDLPYALTPLVRGIRDLNDGGRTYQTVSPGAAPRSKAP